MPTDNQLPASQCPSTDTRVPHSSRSPVVRVTQKPVGNEPLSDDVQAFCALIARIMVRCIKERDERVLTILSLQKKPAKQEKKKEEKHVSSPQDV